MKISSESGVCWRACVYVCVCERENVFLSLLFLGCLVVLNSSQNHNIAAIEPDLLLLHNNISGMYLIISYIILIIFEEGFSKRPSQNSPVSLDKILSHAHVETSHWPGESVQDGFILLIRIHSSVVGLRLTSLEVFAGDGVIGFLGRKGEKGFERQ